MKRQLVITSDGSHTFYVPELNEHYHSTFGALAESQHIFIKNGFNLVKKDQVNVLEIGFGTGLNALLTLVESEKSCKSVYFESIEKYPLQSDEISSLNFTKKKYSEYGSLFKKIHETSWDVEVGITNNFKLLKLKTDIKDFNTGIKFDVIYFDAFAPDVQPDLWTKDIFIKLYNYLNTGGLLVTYSVKGTVKNNLKEAGFKIEKFTGPPGGKRENLRALK